MLDKKVKNPGTLEGDVTKEDMEMIAKEAAEKIKNEDRYIPDYPDADPNPNPSETVSGDTKTDKNSK